MARKCTKFPVRGKIKSVSRNSLDIVEPDLFNLYAQPMERFGAVGRDFRTIEGYTSQSELKVLSTGEARGGPHEGLIITSIGTSGLVATSMGQTEGPKS